MITRSSHCSLLNQAKTRTLTTDATKSSRIARSNEKQSNRQRTRLMRISSSSSSSTLFSAMNKARTNARLNKVKAGNAADGDDSDGRTNAAAGSDIDEEEDFNERTMKKMLEKLEKAEKEKAQLQKRLDESTAAKAQAVARASDQSEETENKTIDELARMKPRKLEGNLRIDGEMQRERIFDFGSKTKNASREQNWLNDGLEFVSKEQPSEELTVAEMSKEDQDIVNRRLIIGIGLTVGFCAFGLVPDDKLVLPGARPEKPLFFYLVPICKSREILRNCEELAVDGDFDQLLNNVQKVLKEPNSIKKNLLLACVFLSGREEENAKELALNIVEDIEKVDFKTYFDTQKKTFDGKQAQQYADFSAKAAVAAVKKINTFLQYFDSESREAAESQVVIFKSSRRNNTGGEDTATNNGGDQIEQIGRAHV